jgi:hypothetical protein
MKLIPYILELEMFSQSYFLLIDLNKDTLNLKMAET